MPSWCHSLQDKEISFVCSDSAVPSLADKRQELLENSCWCVQVFEIPLATNIPEFRTKEHHIPVPVQYLKVTAT